MKIATFNVNGINKRLANLLAWLKVAQPDIVCLQELKAEQGAFPEEAILDAGYDAVWTGQRSWNGVAILSRVGAPVLTRAKLPGDASDEQARYIEVLWRASSSPRSMRPTGTRSPAPNFDYKLAWPRHLARHPDLKQVNGA